jgi:malate synthase
LIQTSHKRGVHAMGGMAAQIPIKGDPEGNERALAKVRDDKLREVQNGHDGTWVAHPALVPVAMEIFDEYMPEPNQLGNLRTDVTIGEADLLAVPAGARTEHALRHNIKVCVQYIESWLRGQGCVPLYHLMEDAATAEISRAQVWQWRAHAAPIAWDDGGTRPVSAGDLRRIVDEEILAIEGEIGGERMTAAESKFREATELFLSLSLADAFEEFLTLPAYERMLKS